MLTLDGLKSYTALLGDLQVLSASFSTVFVKSVKEPEFEPTVDGPGDEESSLENQAVIAATDETKPSSSLPTIAPPVYGYNDPIHESLARLARSLRQRETASSSPDDHLHQAQSSSSAPRSLTEKIQALKEEMYLINISYPRKYSLSSLANYTTHFAALAPETDAFNQSRGAAADDRHQKVIDDFKSEMRGLKGMLLNRRNFASWTTA